MSGKETNFTEITDSIDFLNKIRNNDIKLED